MVSAEAREWVALQRAGPGAQEVKFARQDSTFKGLAGTEPTVPWRDPRGVQGGMPRGLKFGCFHMAQCCPQSLSCDPVLGCAGEKGGAGAC